MSAETCHRIAIPWQFCGMLVLLLSFNSFAQDSTRLDHVRAAYLFQFTKFTQWPAGAGEELVIGLYGGDTLNGAQQSVEGRQSQGRTLRFVQVLTENPLPSDCCDMLYIREVASSAIARISSELSTEAVLVVTEMESAGPELEWNINLVRRGTRLKFEVNLNQSNSAGIDLSSELIKNAATVYRN